MQSIVLGGGCFWCTESVFQKLKGVVGVTSGYMGGQADTADYQSVCTGQTGHIEVIKIQFDETFVSLDEILDVFFVIHDPTTQDRQGADVGTQYASVIFYADEKQRQLAIQKIHTLIAQGVPVVTEVLPVQPFYEAEAYHQDFFNKNPTQGYCTLTIPPKWQKLEQYFSHLLK